MRIISATMGKPIRCLYWILTPKLPGRDPGALLYDGVFNCGSGEGNFTSEFKARKKRLIH